MTLPRILCWLPESPETVEHREDILNDDVQLRIRHGLEFINQQLSRNPRYQSKYLSSYDNTVECFNTRGMSNLK